MAVQLVKKLQVENAELFEREKRKVDDFREREDIDVNSNSAPDSSSGAAAPPATHSSPPTLVDDHDQDMAATNDDEDDDDSRPNLEYVPNLAGKNIKKGNMRAK